MIFFFTEWTFAKKRSNSRQKFFRIKYNVWIFDLAKVQILLWLQTLRIVLNHLSKSSKTTHRFQGSLQLICLSKYKYLWQDIFKEEWIDHILKSNFFLYINNFRLIPAKRRPVQQPTTTPTLTIHVFVQHPSYQHSPVSLRPPPATLLSQWSEDPLVMK